MKLPDLLWCQRVETVGWDYENWLQQEYGIEDEIEDVEEEEIEEVEIDVSNLKPGVNLHKIKISDWKENDHYAILGLQDIRYKATDKQLKAVHKALVLKYHPDKLGREATKKDEEAFACITKSAEILSDSQKRRAFDSVDPEFDNSIPKGDPKDLIKNFYTIFEPVFERNSRWAIHRSKVLKLGDENSSRREVENFYSYWYDFKSWRDFHWEDEEDPEQASDRWERRHIEKLNKVERSKKKKAETARIRKLVDLAYESDPRIASFVAADKEARDAAKRAKKEEVKKYKEEQARIAREEEERKKAEQEAEKKRLADIEAEKKKIAKAEANACKKERKKLRQTAKDNNYWVGEDKQIEMMENVEFLCQAFDSIKLIEINKQLNDLESDCQADFVVKTIDDHKQKETARTEALNEKLKVDKAKDTIKSGGWSVGDVQLLTKAMVVIPNGTLNRWDVISVWMNDHGAEKERESKTILKKAKELEKSAAKGPLDSAAAFAQFQKDQNKKKSDINSADQAEASVNYQKEAEKKAWSQDEQTRLEQALRTYGPKEPERWEKIQSAVPTRTKRECMLRYKELAEAAKAKKLAMAKAKKMAS